MLIGDFHRRNAPGGNYPTASGIRESDANVGRALALDEGDQPGHDF
jgi:hypothetical protein